MKHVEELIIRHFADDDLSAAEREEMRAHLRGCDACRDQYDQVAGVMRASAGGEDPTSQEMAAWRRGIEQALEPVVEEGPRPRGWLARLVPAVALAAAVVVAVVLLRTDTAQDSPNQVPPKWSEIQVPPKWPKVQYRGAPDAGAAQQPKKTPILVNLELHAISTASGVPVPRRLNEGDTVYLDEYLQVSRICSGAGLKYIYVLAVNSKLEPLDYFPRPSTSQSVELADCSTTPAAVGRSIRLARRHPAGPLRILALYSQKPLSRTTVHGAIAQARSGLTASADVGNIVFGAGVFSTVKGLVVKEAKR